MFGIIIIIFLIIIFNNFDYLLSFNLSFFNLKLNSLVTSLGQCSLVSLGQCSLVSLGYKIIYYYSVCQIKCNRLYNIILPYLGMFKSDNKLIDDIKMKTIELEIIYREDAIFRKRV